MPKKVKSKLKPCPFCQRDGWTVGFRTNYYAIPRRLYWIECCACNARGPEAESVELAKLAWNRRARRKP